MTSQELQDEIKRLESLLQEKTDRLQEAQDTLDAIRSGAVDGLVRSTAEGDQVFLLKGSDAPYRNLIEQMNEGALLVSETGTILFCNLGFARLVDAPLEKIMGSNIKEWVNPSSTFSVEMLSHKSELDKRLFEVAFKTTKQQLVPTQLSVNKISLDSINASALIVTDLTKHMEAEIKRYTINLEKEITERKKAEEALRKATEQEIYEKKRLETFLETSPAAIVIIDVPDGKFSFLNNRALELYGMDFKNVDLATNVAKVRATKPNGTAYKVNEVPASRALTQGENVRNEEMIIYRADGKAIPVIVSAAPIRDTKGNIASAVIVFEDITERKKAEEGLKQAQAKLQEHAKDLESLVEERTKKLQDAQRLAAIGQVAGMVGHDIRNPLQAIVGELYFAKETMKELPKENTKEAFESLYFIQEQTDYISKIVADLQDYSKPLKPDFSTVELCEFISEALKAIVIPASIQTAFNCEKIIPQIRLDKTFTTRVLTNLVNNAVQAMPQGGKLTINASVHNNSATITVEDTGVGIPEDVKPKMFTPLFTTKSKGQGFGLPVVKRLVEAQGGTISFESTVGKGTKFIVTLPLTR